MSFYGSRQFPGTPPTSVPSGRRPYHSSQISSIPPINSRPLVHPPSYHKPSYYNEKSNFSLNYSPSKYASPSSHAYQNGGGVKQNDSAIKYKLREMHKKEESSSASRNNRPIKSTFNVIYEPKSINSRLKKTTEQLSNLSLTKSLKKSSSHQDMANQEDYTSAKSPFRSIGRTATRHDTAVHSSYQSSYSILLNKPSSRQRNSNSLSVKQRDKHYETNEEEDEDEDGLLFCMGNNNHKSTTKYPDDKESSHKLPNLSTASSNYSINNNFSKLYSNKGLTGLQNIGNTCFMNCVLQCLSNTRPLLELSLDPPPNLLRDNKSRLRGSLILSYKDLMQGMWRGSETFSPSYFKAEVSKFARVFAGYNQQDAQEFLMYLLQGLHDELNRGQSNKKKGCMEIQRVLDNPNLSVSEKSKKCWKVHLEFENSYVVDIFEGQLKSALTCSLCGYVSNTFDPFLGLSLPIVKMSNRGETTLVDCLDLFTQEELLGENEKTTCDKCRRKQNSTKRLSIQKFPNILIIHLKRFSDVGIFRSKLTTLVSFPVKKLDLAKYSDEYDVDAMYRLYGVCNHSGTLSAGHYTAYARHPYTSQWHHFNDSRVSQLSDGNIVSSEAYILFYELLK